MQRENFQYCSTRMDARLARTPYHPDLWSRILETEGGEALSSDECRSNSVLFMIAVQSYWKLHTLTKAKETNTGSETTATALCGMIYLLHLSKHRRILDDLKAEVRGSFESIKDMTFERLAQLKYMHAVIQESLRIYPPVRTREVFLPFMLLLTTMPRPQAHYQGRHSPEACPSVAISYLVMSQWVSTLWQLSIHQCTLKTLKNSTPSVGSMTPNIRTTILMR